MKKETKDKQRNVVEFT